MSAAKPADLRALLLRLGAAAEVVEASAERHRHRQRSCIVPDDALDDLANAASAARDALGLEGSFLFEAGEREAGR